MKRWPLCVTVLAAACAGQPGAGSRPAAQPEAPEPAATAHEAEAVAAPTAPTAPPRSTGSATSTQATQPPDADTPPADAPAVDDAAAMMKVCTAIADVIQKRSADCATMGVDLAQVMKPTSLVQAYQAAIVSKRADHPFRLAEIHCDQALPVERLRRFWTCRKDPGVWAAFELMNALKP